MADSYDAMTSFRNYRRNKNMGEAIEELNLCAGTQFDKDIVDVFTEQRHARIGSQAIAEHFARLFEQQRLRATIPAERGEALSGDRITEIYGDILRRYHGHDEGVVVIDDLYTNEWMFVPHFYFNMYVYQYATSQTAGTALYAKIVEDGEDGVENYKNLLRAGGSNYPYLLLADAGVDMAKPGPYRAQVAQMNAIMDEMERLLDELD